MQNQESIKSPSLYIPFLSLEKDAGGMGDLSPIDVYSAPLSLGRGRRLKVKEKNKFVFLYASRIFFEALKNPFRLTEVCI